MASHLHIKLLHMELSNTQARIISLLLYGLEYAGIAAYLGRSAKTVINNMSTVINTLELSGPFHLLRLAHDEDFGYEGTCCNIFLFTPDELALLHKRFPARTRVSTINRPLVGWHRYITAPELPMRYRSFTWLPPLLTLLFGMLTEANPIVTDAIRFVSKACRIGTEVLAIVTEVKPIVTEVLTIVTEAKPIVTEVLAFVTEAKPIVTEVLAFVIEVKLIVTEVKPIVTEVLTFGTKRHGFVTKRIASVQKRAAPVQKRWQPGSDGAHGEQKR